MLETWLLFYIIIGDAKAPRHVLAGEYQTEERCRISAVRNIEVAKQFFHAKSVRWYCKKNGSISTLSTWHF